MTTKKIAVPVEGDYLSAHFGHAPAFDIFTVNDGVAVSKETLPAPPHEPGAIPKWLNSLSVNIIIAGGMGAMAQELFRKFNIEIRGGAAGMKSSEIVAQYLDGFVKSDITPCDHSAHDHGHDHECKH